MWEGPAKELVNRCLMAVSSPVLTAGLILVVACTQAIGQGPTPAEEDMAHARELRRNVRCEEAAGIYRRLLKNPTLSRELRIRTHMCLADTLEAIRGSGEQARQVYRQIRDAYPEHRVSAEAAYRLGCLYHSILLPGTKKSVDKAVEQFEYVLKHAPGNTMLALKAHMNLGNLAAGRKKFDKAEGHFQAIYDAEAVALPEPDEMGGLPGAERKRTDKRLLEDFEHIKSRAADKLVANCIRPDPAESLRELRDLRNRYPDDPKIEALATKAGQKVVASLTEEDDLDEGVRTMPLPEPSGANADASNAGKGEDGSSPERVTSLTGRVGRPSAGGVAERGHSRTPWLSAVIGGGAAAAFLVGVAVVTLRRRDARSFRRAARGIIPRRPADDG